MTAYRITNAAKLDFRTVLRETREQFGTGQREIYRRLIARGVKMVTAEAG